MAGGPSYFIVGFTAQLRFVQGLPVCLSAHATDHNKHDILILNKIPIAYSRLCMSCDHVNLIIHNYITHNYLIPA